MNDKESNHERKQRPIFKGNKNQDTIGSFLLARQTSSFLFGFFFFLEHIFSWASSNFPSSGRVTVVDFNYCQN